MEGNVPLEEFSNCKCILRSVLEPTVTHHMSCCVTETHEQTVPIVPLSQGWSLELREGESLGSGLCQTLNSPGV